MKDLIRDIDKARGLYVLWVEHYPRSLNEKQQFM